MNAQKSRALRAALHFHPGAPREYEHARPVQKIRMTAEGPKPYVVTGTITSTGARRQYQAAKRAGMASYILGAR